MEIRICENPAALGASAAEYTAKILNDAIAKKGSARIVLSTGASQFDTIANLVKQDVDWSKVEMFHLDEYVDLPETHVASFRKYLKEKFVAHVPTLKAAHFVDGTKEGIAELTKELRSAPIDVGLIGIGENAHIAFNDPPADFDTKEAYIIVNLNDTCKQQQVGEGWFATVDDVPKQAVSMTVHQILQCEKIVSCVPYKVKANAIKATLENDVTNTVPATIMKGHKDFVLYVDRDSASLVF
ncbi:MAG: 6-phosphogluconolactonase [Clostridia bacterium]|nr:6-phosphogluconolactonase [Clostridia bacterium]MBR2878122.1 6-phosphogluconolactonase [Clostridia bacterium]MBR2972705.1 6-phosphogluconolactonase [Clostridia bacterium]MBR3576376.1 6-phosphogluconolactonase [Clostridia bacterium]